MHHMTEAEVSNSIPSSCIKAGRAFPMNADYYSVSKHIADPDFYGCKDRHLYFLICESCFWCATHINSDRVVAKCPVCKDNRIEALPILYDEKIRV